MNDPHFLVENPEAVKTSLRRRQMPELADQVDRLVQLAEQRSTLIRERDGLLHQRNTLSKEIGQLYRQGRRDEAEGIKAKVQAGNERVSGIEESLKLVEEERTNLSMGLPNLLHEDVPDGVNEDDNPIVREVGERTTLDFEPQPHVEVGTRLGILDLERSAKLSGARFWLLTGAGARLERAIINFFLDLHTTEHGYTEVLAPYIVHRRILEGTGQLPKFEEDLFKLDRPLNGSDAFLIPTAEVPVTNIYREEILELDRLPIKFAGFTPCFRAEAGSAGRDVRGLIRVHQFHKVELVWVTTPEHADQAHEELLSHAEEALRRLGLSYRVVLHCAGEVSFSAQKCYDLEVWLPSQQAYREISSVSNYGSFQARRMALRYRPEPPEGKKKAKARVAATLNGSGLAVGRTMVAILENNQQADGSVIIPEVLRPYMGGLEVLEPKA